MQETSIFFSFSQNVYCMEMCNEGWKETNRFFLAHLSTTCSRGASRVVYCPSCVIDNFFIHLLLPNCLADLDQTWQECSLGSPLQKMFTEFDSIKNSGCHSNKIFLSNSLKIFSLGTVGQILK